MKYEQSITYIHTGRLFYNATIKQSYMFVFSRNCTKYFKSIVKGKLPSETVGDKQNAVSNQA